MIGRLAVLAVVILLAWWLVSWWDRRSGSAVKVPNGVTLVTTASCAICPTAIDALEAAGLSLSIVDATSAESNSWGIRSVPTLLVGDGSGGEALRRSGRAVITDIEHIRGVVTASV